MATAAALIPEIAPWSWRPLYRLSVDQYHRMIEAGVLVSGERVELLEGLLVAKMPQHPPHAATLTRITPRFVKLLPEQWLLRIQCPITLQDSEPEPDLAVARGPEERYNAAHPVPRDIALLIEVADSTLLHDRREKGRLYAEAKITQYWIVNLVESQVEVYTRPRAGRSATYLQKQVFVVGESVPVTLAGDEIVQLEVRDLLPKAL
jgi:Uma2 family endonuclease